MCPFVSIRSLRAVDQMNIPSRRSVDRYKLFSTELHNSILWRKRSKLKSMEETPGNAEGVGRYFSAQPRIISSMAFSNAAKTKR